MAPPQQLQAVAEVGPSFGPLYSAENECTPLYASPIRQAQSHSFWGVDKAQKLIGPSYKCNH